MEITFSGGCSSLFRRLFDLIREIQNMDGSPIPQKFHSLLQTVGISIPSGLANPLITQATCDSRCVQKGSLFLGLPGEHVDGGVFWKEAFEAGAVAAVISSSAAELNIPGPKDCVIAISQSIEQWSGELVSAFWQMPSLKLSLIGVTGTNGKTTTTFLIDHLMQALGKPSALFGTLINRWPGHSALATRTTAFTDSLQSSLAQAVDAGAQLAAMEVSSHALSQQRIAGCRFSGAVFTNLTQDHLDYHNSMEAYFQAKALLFAPPLLDQGRNKAVVNIDDTWGRRLANDLGDMCWRCSLREDFSGLDQAELSISQVSTYSSGFKGLFRSPLGEGWLSSPLIGEFNLMNVLQAVGVLLQQGIPLPDLLKAVETFPGVPGRMERITIPGYDHFVGLLPLVLVDYAHTPDGLKKALIAARPFADGQLVCVFGCGGDRDRGKRPQMGAVATQFADRVFLTSDNPRTEDPNQIFDDVMSGIIPREKVSVEADRSSAIATAISEAAPDDVVLIAGKGHEDYQIFGSETIHFDDREEVSKVLIDRSNFN